MTDTTTNDTPTTDPRDVEASETTPHTARDVVEAPEVEQEADEGTGRRDPAARARREAANLRQRLREAEEARDAALAEVDTAAETLARALQMRDDVARAEVERLAADAGLHNPADVWLTGHDLGAFLDDDSDAVEASKVAEVVAAMLRERPYMGKQERRIYGQTPVEALTSGHLSSGMGSRFGSSGGRGWADVLGS